MAWFTGKKAFITGSSRGIGKACALALAKEGCSVLIHYRRDKEAAQAVVEEIKDQGVSAWLYQADLCDLDQTQAMLSQIKNDHTELDIFVANAASTAFKALSDLNSSHMTKTFNLVVQSFVLSVQALTPLLANRDSQVLTISGIDTVKFCPGHGLLAAAKASLETLSKYFAVELASQKIHVKTFNPGLIATDSTRFYMGDAFESICQQADQIAPQKGFAQPSDIAQMMLHLLDPKANWMSTQTIYADGGLGFMLPVFGPKP